MARPSQRFLDELSHSHTVFTYVDVKAPTGETRRLIVTDGSVTVDRTATTRRAGQITCMDPLGTFTPAGNRGILTPFGTEVLPYRGVMYDDGSTEVYPLGIFRLAKVELHESLQQQIEIKMDYFDLSRVIARDKFTDTYTLKQGTSVVAAIQQLIVRTYPNQTFDSISSGMTIQATKVYNAGGDPWAEATTLAVSLGCDLWFDIHGVVHIQPPVDLDTQPTPAFTYIEGEGCTMTDLVVDYTDDPGFNGVIVIGASPGNNQPPVRGEAWDLEPSSPTYRYGSYGQVPSIVNDSTITDASTAAASAASILHGLLGFSQQLQVTSWVNPAIEAGDICRVVRAALNIDALYTIESASVDFKKDGQQTIKMRERRILG